ncbi:PREDICTED: insulin-like [Rhagoletis zephyria]|uniref:insulin-like n=1 Tax=Rhagoletis zephyria TaxID=28612 RepID=UPI000811385A|nr:PREDICTED: insulin-like [Rhagoletis zephyria]XP_017467984.1 PREDICTED: insulin-like [Rhagoletis zephyria]XP_036339630.1 insulin-like [Rhagoletis pomonella]
MMFPQYSASFPNLLCLSLIVISLVFCLDLSSHCTEAQPLLPGGGSDVEFKRYCSTNLSDAIRLICGGRYYSLSRKFPDSVGMGHVSSLKRLAGEDGEYRQPFQGAIHECCRRPCGYSELKSYCDPDY